VCAARADPAHAEEMFAAAQRDIDDQRHYYEQMAGIERNLIQENEVELLCAPT
jgi:hypothetical protein